jgi:chromosome partitioning protein
MKKIAIWTKKGGVGKTTTACTIGHWLSKNGKQVCLVDADSQYNLTTMLGVPQTKIVGTLKDVLKAEKPFEDFIINARDKLCLIPSNKDLASYRSVITDIRPPEFALKRRMGESEPWNYMIFDCPPGTDLLIDNVLVYVDEVWSPLQAAFLSFEGLTQVTDSLDSLRKDFPHDVNVKLKYIIPTLFDKRTALAKEVVDLAKQKFSILVTNVIHRSVRVEEAPSHGQTIFEYDPENIVAKDYSELGRLVLNV